MSTKVSRLKRILGSLFREGDEETQSKFIYFWDDIVDFELEKREKPQQSFSELLRENQIFVTSIITIFFVIPPVIFAYLELPLYAMISSFVLIIIIFIFYIANNNKYQTTLVLMRKKSERFKENNFSAEDEFLIGVSDNIAIKNLNEFRNSMNQTLKMLVQSYREMNYQLSVIENKFGKTSSSLGQANLSFDQSLANIASYQEYKGYLVLSSSGIDTLTSAFDDSIGEIYKVIKLLKSLGKQTQMLALNAGIEASRSEEYGAGFEVVASNLRRLSNHITNSAGDVKNQISSISERAKESLELITGSMQQIGDKLDQGHQVSLSIQNDVNNSSRDFNAVQTNYDELLKIIRNMEGELDKFSF